MKRHSPTRSSMLAMAVAALALGASSAPLRAAQSRSLESIQVHALPGEHLQLTLHLSSPAPQPVAFTIDNPARISIDLPDTTLALPSRRIDVHTGGLDTVLAAEGKDRSRIVLDLDRMVPYTTQVSGDDVIVTLGASTVQTGDGPTSAANSGAAPAAAPAADAPAATSSLNYTSSSATGVRAIRSVDFRRTSDGGGRVIVDLTDPHTAINLRQVGNQIVVDFADTELPRDLMRRYDATDFGTPVRDFDVTHSGDNTEMVIDATGDYDQLAYQTDGRYVVEVQPQRKTASGEAPKRKYTGERLTLNFQNINTRAVLQLLADASGQNIVVSDSVHGSVTLRLQNVPWDEALDIILRTKGLGKRQEGNVIIVAPAAELAAREKEELAAEKNVQELEPLQSEFLQINYAKAADLAALIKSHTGSLLSPRGSVSVDKRTNTLLLQDTPEHLADIRRLVATLDVPVRQVLIEARVVIVNNDFERELGTVLGLTGVARNGANGLLTTSGTAAGTDSLMQGSITGTGFPTSAPAPAERYNINLPTPDSGGSIAFGVLGSDYLVDLELSAAQMETRADIVSAPRVVTANQQKAVILQGTEIPYQQSASSGATTIQFEKAVLSLTVTPQITPDNRIILDLDVKDDSVGTVVVQSGGVNVPSIDTQEVTDQVVVNDGQTVVLGGILVTTNRVDQTKIPVLGDIPVLGNLFKQTIRKNDKDELLVFVTPKIIHQGVTVY
ncbi:MAG: type IV pilus secretin PilQ [Steroidobacteraceae bacterium]